jgi:hypothetical protein
LVRKGLNPGKIDGVFGTKAKRALQEFLRVRGFDVGRIDGFFGPRSVMALQGWLRKGSSAAPEGGADGRGLATDGIWGPLTSSALQRTLNAELGASSPRPRKSVPGNAPQQRTSLRQRRSVDGATPSTSASTPRGSRN